MGQSVRVFMCVYGCAYCTCVLGVDDGNAAGAHARQQCRVVVVQQLQRTREEAVEAHARVVNGHVGATVLHLCVVAIARQVLNRMVYRANVDRNNGRSPRGPSRDGVIEEFRQVEVESVNSSDNKFTIKRGWR